MGGINDKIIFDWYRTGHLRPRRQFQCCSFVTSTSSRGIRHVIWVVVCFFTLSLIAITPSTLKLGATDSESLSHNLQELFIDYFSQVWTDARRISWQGRQKCLSLYSLSCWESLHAFLEPDLNYLMPENKSRDTLFVVVRGLRWRYWNHYVN